MTWTFHLNINNQSGRDLTTAAGDYDLKWGTWYRDNTDDNAPISVSDGNNKQVLGIRAARGTWTGYECICTWRDATTGSGNLGTVTLSIDVPFSGSNSSSFTPSGLYQTDGWTELPSSGNSFVRSVTITAIDDSLVVTEDSAEILTDELASVEKSYNEYEVLLSEANELIEDWSKFERDVPAGPIDPISSMPDTPTYPPQSFILGRSAPSTIDKSKWDGLADPRYESAYAKKTFVDEYFSVAAYFINTDPRAWESIAAGTAKTKMTSTEVTSSVKTVLETNFSIKVSLEAKAGNKKLGREISAKLETEYSQKNVLEESRSRVDVETITVDVPPAPENRLFVPWVFSTAIMIYRKTKSGKYALVAISEWADTQLYKTYKYD